MRPTHAILLPLLAVACLAPASRASGQADPFERTKPLVVMIDGELDGAPTVGAGIIVGRAADQFYVLTANHVVRRGGREAQRVRVLLSGLGDRWLDARLTPHSDPSPPGLDLAVLSVRGLAHGAADLCKLGVDRLGSSDSLRRGSPVYPLGYPQGRVQWGMPVTAQRVAQLSRHQILFEAAGIVPGYSGGALTSEEGHILGLVQSHDAPFAAAIRMDTILTILRTWNYPVELRREDEPSPLFAAVVAGDASAVGRLVQAPCARVDERHQGWTPLQKAAELGHAAIVRTMLRSGAQPKALIDHPDYKDFTALQIAADTGHVEVVKELLDAGAAVDETGRRYRQTPLELAVWEGRREAARVLRSAGASTAFVNEAAPGDADTPLHRAAKNGRLEVVKLLIELGARVNARNRSGLTPLFDAIDEAHVEIAMALIAAGADVNARTESAKSPLAVLIDEAWVDDENERRRRPSVEPALLRIAGAMLAAGARLDDVGRGSDDSRMTALGKASERHQVAVVRFLLRNGAKVNERDSRGRTALFQAAEAAGDSAAQRELLSVLLAAGADVNALDAAGDPPLCRALWGDPAMPRIRVAELMLKAGARALFMERCKSKSGRSWAPDEELDRLLRSHGAR